MSHELDMSNGRANMAFTGSRSAIWHGLGSELEEGASIDEWKVAAGLDWRILTAPVIYRVPVCDDMGLESLSEDRVFTEKFVLFRSDTQKPLSVMGNNYRIVQPEQMLEFFRDLLAKYDMKLSTAGSLFEGRRFWALAETGRAGEILKNDTIRGNLLIVSSCDGSGSTIVKFVSTRVVCNNTLTVALGENARSIYRQTHHAEWDPERAKLEIGLIDNSWDTFMGDLKRLSEREMSGQEVTDFFKRTCFDPKKNEADQTRTTYKNVDILQNLYANGPGAQMAHGTAWGALNAVTNLFTHGNGQNRSPDRQFVNGMIDNDFTKSRAMRDLLEIA